MAKSKGMIVIHENRCKGCQLCISVCPTGAMQSGYFDDGALLSFLERIGSLKGKDIVLGEENDLHALWWQNQGQKESMCV